MAEHIPVADPKMERRVIPGTIETVFEFDYSVQAEDMRGLYEKAKRDQWNACRDIAWDTAEPSDGRVLADELVDIHGSPIWDRLSETRPGGAEPAHRRVAALGAGLRRAGRDAGVQPDGGHRARAPTRSSSRPPRSWTRRGTTRSWSGTSRHASAGLHYPMPENERVLFDAILTDKRWYIKTIALQLVAETFAVAIFKMMGEAPRIRSSAEVCTRILQDESRHMGFGMLALPDIVREATDAERQEMEDFTCLALEKVLTGFFPIEAYRDIGFSRAQIDEVKVYRRDVAARNDYAVFRKYFKRDMHASMVEQPRPDRAPDRARAPAPRRPRYRAARGELSSEGATPPCRTSPRKAACAGGARARSGPGSRSTSCRDRRTARGGGGRGTRRAPARERPRRGRARVGRAGPAAAGRSRDPRPTSPPVALSAFREPVAVLPAREGPARPARPRSGRARRSSRTITRQRPGSHDRAEVEHGARGQPRRRRRQPARPGPRGWTRSRLRGSAKNSNTSGRGRGSHTRRSRM